MKNKNYWNAGHPYVDEVMFQIYNDPQAMVTALEAGALHAANKPPLVDAARLQKDPSVLKGFGATADLPFAVSSPAYDAPETSTTRSISTKFGH